MKELSTILWGRCHRLGGVPLLLNRVMGNPVANWSLFPWTCQVVETNWLPTNKQGGVLNMEKKEGIQLNSLSFLVISWFGACHFGTIRFLGFVKFSYSCFDTSLQPYHKWFGCILHHHLQDYNTIITKNGKQYLTITKMATFFL